MSPGNPLKVEIEWQGVSPRNLVGQLRQELPEIHRRSVSLHVPSSRRQPDSLALDPTIAVALITGGASVLVAIISALVTLMVQRGGGRVLVSLPDGTKLEFPTALTSAQVDEIVAALQRSQGGRIIIPG